MQEICNALLLWDRVFFVDEQGWGAKKENNIPVANDEHFELEMKKKKSCLLELSMNFVLSSHWVKYKQNILQGTHFSQTQ